MRHFPVITKLRHTPSGFYFGGRHVWVATPESALDLGTIEHAAQVGGEVEFDGMEILASFDEPDCQLAFPLASKASGRPHSTR